MNNFSSQNDCIEFLESILWADGPACPYCFSKDKLVRIKDNHRYHCNNCNTGFSVTVNTIFHDTKLPLQKWFLGITLILKGRGGLNSRQLQESLRVTYKTAWYIRMRVRRALIDNSYLLEAIAAHGPAFKSVISNINEVSIGVVERATLAINNKEVI